MSAIIILSAVIVLNIAILVLYYFFGRRTNENPSEKEENDFKWERTSTAPPTFIK